MRILIVNPFGIGDVLFSTPLITNLREIYPESYIGYICNIRSKDVLYDNPQINEVFVFEKDEYRNLWKQAKLKCIKSFIAFLIKIKRKRFDLAIDLSLSHQYSLFLWLIGIKKRIGYNYRNRGRFLTHKIGISGYNDKPIADYYLDLLKFLNIKSKGFNLTMGIPVKDKNWADEFFKNNGLKEDGLIVGIIPAGGASWGKDFSYRHWPWENYAAVVDKLIAKLNAKIIIFGDFSEQNICQRVQDAIQENAISACGKTSLKQFAALLGKCNLVVCNDGGPLHVAVSQNVKTVSIFGPVDEKVYGPYPPGPKHIVITKNIDCRPCYRRFKLPACRRNRQCIRAITAEEVFNIIKINLQRQR
ncbi:MAG: glycosyltransferase family 9 protein [Candidatus Omnitrophica bacterium]|nr:glycosyltransferase family 9 protein [Candidatus Omnitrophota bacterium]